MFHTDDEFLREIERQPAERTLRLVYADWLDERDDPRRALIRIEEEMRQGPGVAGRVWGVEARPHPPPAGGGGGGGRWPGRSGAAGCATGRSASRCSGTASRTAGASGGG